MPPFINLNTWNSNENIIAQLILDIKQKAKNCLELKLKNRRFVPISDILTSTTMRLLSLRIWFYKAFIWMAPSAPYVCKIVGTTCFGIWCNENNIASVLGRQKIGCDQNNRRWGCMDTFVFIVVWMNFNDLFNLPSFQSTSIVWMRSMYQGWTNAGLFLDAAAVLYEVMIMGTVPMLPGQNWFFLQKFVKPLKLLLCLVWSSCINKTLC